eukprot:scaffold123498_cov15-Tisochrysis_lutea.AAC.1
MASQAVFLLIDKTHVLTMNIAGRVPAIGKTPVLTMDIAGCVPAHRQNLCTHHEHCGGDQGLDAHLLLLLPVQGAPHALELGWLRFLLLR